ncbi:MAG: DUF2341 domain-containing protein [Planctomycetales bacterium]|nr:DUF2341 domain-containing protein [Planctomycetales bacterium]
MKRSHCIVTALLLGLLAAPRLASAQYGDWLHHGTLALLTTPDGADLPDSAREENFPLLVRLSRETFDFGQANSDGSDIRFSAAGEPLAYQIERWDAIAGEACLWVRIPVIRGNARQELGIHWGNANAVSESNGKSVFNRSNGYAVVMHLGEDSDSLKDEVGAVSPVDRGAEPCRGAIGLARRFDVGRGIACGEQIERLPAGMESCSTEVWFRAHQVNGTVLGWGNEQAQGKVVLQVRSPPHVNLDCYFSNANVASSKGRLPMSEWVHVAHVYQHGDTRLYVNGQLDGVSNAQGSPLNIRRPARMWLGGWYNNFRFVGDIDEVRVSTVERSADWVKLSYENQKPRQTLVGTLAQAGSELAVTPESATIPEGQSLTFAARAGGAEKVYWLLRRGDMETVVASDCFSYALDAGRVAGDESLSLRLKAVYRDGAKTVDIPITVKDSIPEPQFVLEGPSRWNGRDKVEIIARVTNQEAMAAAGAGELRYRWTVVGGAVSKEMAPGRLILKRSLCSGPLRVTALVDNGGAVVEASTELRVTEPASDPWVHRNPGDDERPVEGQFYARDDRNEGTLHYIGALDRPADSVFLKVYADDRLFSEQTQPLAEHKRYRLSVKLKPGLIKYRVEFGALTAGQERVLDRVGELVCGDAYLIDGQSNALATDTREDAPLETSEWIRSYGGPTGRADGAAWVRDRISEAQEAGLERPNLWSQPVWNRGSSEHQTELGWWGMQLARRLVDRQKVPICVIQAAVGGSRIDEHQADPTDHANLSTMYGRMLWRVRQARLTHGIRAVIWHQGENDQGADGPTGGYGWETYQDLFTDMAAAWKEDMPNIQHYYVFQIWPNACAMGGRDGSGDRLRDAQRTLPRLFSRMSIMSTLGVKPPGGCHFPLEGWTEFARMIQPLIERDLYGATASRPITPPDVRSVRFANAARDVISLEFDQPVVWHDGLVREFYLNDPNAKIAAGRADGNVITLKLDGPTVSTRITYLKERDWSQDRLILGANGLAALSFCEVEIEPLK